MCLEFLLLAGSSGKLQLNFRNSAMQMIIGCRFVLKVSKEVGCCDLAFGCAAPREVQAATGTLLSAKPQFKLNAFEAPSTGRHGLNYLTAANQLLPSNLQSTKN